MGSFLGGWQLDGRPGPVWQDGFEGKRPAMAGYDLLYNGEADACASPTRLGGKKWFQHATGVCRRDTRAVIDNGNNQSSISISCARKNGDGPLVCAGIAGIEHKVHDRMLEQARIPMNDGEIWCRFNQQSNAGFGEAMFDERHCPGDQGRWLNGFGGGPIASGQPKKSTDNSVNPIDLFKNDADTARCPLVICKFGNELFGPAGNDPKRCGNLVCNPNREGSHGGSPSCTLQALVALNGEVGDFQAMTQQKLFALIAHGQPTEAQHQAARGGNTQQQAPARPAFAIALAFGACHSCNSPHARCTCVKS